MPAKKSRGERPYTPAKTPAELRALLIAIRRGKSHIKLGDKAANALGQMLELGNDPSLLTITALAKRLKVNPSTLTRLARSLGYSGFATLQRVLLAETFTPVTAFYSRHAQTALRDDGFGLRERVQRLADENTANIAHFTRSFDATAFETAVEALAGRRRVRIHAVRQFLSLATFLTYGLGMIRSDVALLDSPGLGAAEGLAALSPGDVLVVVSCAPYTRYVVEVCRAAKKVGVFTIAITDRASSPLAEDAACSIFVPHETSFLSNSITTFAFCAECLINATATALGEPAAQALEKRDMMIEALGVED